MTPFRQTIRPGDVGSDVIETQVCTICEVEKPLAEFICQGTRKRCKVCHAASVAERKRAKAEGTWKPRYETSPTRVPQDLDYAWAAGFLDGEGYIAALATRTGNTRLVIKASQIDRDPIQRLRDLFGGAVFESRRRTTSGNIVWSWQVNGARAVACLEGIRPYVARKNAKRIDLAVAAYRARPRQGRGRKR